MNRPRPPFFCRDAFWVVATLASIGLTGSDASAARIHLKNGVTLDGEVARIGTLVVNPNTSNSKGGESIVLVDDDLRRTYVSFHQIREVTPNLG